MEVFGTAYVIAYRDVFGQKFEGNRHSFIKNIPRRNLMYELAGVNHRLKPSVKLSFMTNFEGQVKELGRFCNHDQTVAFPYFKVLKEMQLMLENRPGGGRPLIFNRTANLFALAEVLEHPENSNDSFLWNTVEWENLLKYYLCVNDEITTYYNQDNNKTFKPFEKLAAGTIFLNELTIVNDPILTVSRFIDLFRYLENDPNFSNLLKSYFDSIGSEAKNYIKNIFSICFLNSHTNEEARFIHKLDPEKKDHQIAFRIFDYLSRRSLVSKVHPLDIVEVKKSPMFKDKNNLYLILDNTFVIEKLYELFINDFWFETVKPTGMDIRLYRGKIGRFFEEYSVELFKNGFHFLNHPTVMGLDELKVNLPTGSIEIADVYVRHNKKILIGQIKSTGIYSDQFYGTAQALFRNTQEYFYDNFGLHQLISSLKHLRDRSQVFDPKFPIGKRIQVFPILVVNEKAFQTPMFPAMFQLKFKEEVEKEKFDLFDIKPLTIIHISDLERIMPYCASSEVEIWDLLRENYRDSQFPRPFNITLNRGKFKYDHKSAVQKIKVFADLK